MKSMLIQPALLLGLLSAAAARTVLGSPVVAGEQSDDPACWDFGRPCWQAQRAAEALADHLGNEKAPDAATHAPTHAPNGAELTARHALDDLAKAIALAQRDPDEFLSAVVTPKSISKRDPAPWCMSRSHASCWRYARDVAGLESTKLEQRKCLEGDGECALARRAATAVLEALGRDASPAVAERDLAGRQWLPDGRPVPGPWCNRPHGGCYKKARSSDDSPPAAVAVAGKNTGSAEIEARQYLPDGRPVPGGWCNRPRGGCYKKARSPDAESHSSGVSLAKRDVESADALAKKDTEESTDATTEKDAGPAEILARQYLPDGRPVPGGWCNRPRGGCYKKARSPDDTPAPTPSAYAAPAKRNAESADNAETAGVEARQYLPDGRPVPGGWCNRPRGGCYKKARREEPSADTEDGKEDPAEVSSPDDGVQHEDHADEGGLFAPLMRRVYYFYGGRPAPGPWCNRSRGGCWRKRQADDIAKVARSVLDALTVE